MFPRARPQSALINYYLDFIEENMSKNIALGPVLSRDVSAEIAREVLGWSATDIKLKGQLQAVIRDDEPVGYVFGFVGRWFYTSRRPMLEMPFAGANTPLDAARALARALL